MTEKIQTFKTGIRRIDSLVSLIEGILRRNDISNPAEIRSRNDDTFVKLPQGVRPKDILREMTNLKDRIDLLKKLIEDVRDKEARDVLGESVEFFEVKRNAILKDAAKQTENSVTEWEDARKNQVEILSIEGGMVINDLSTMV